MPLFTTKLKSLGKFSFDLLQLRTPVVADPFAGLLGVASMTLTKIQSSSLLLGMRLLLNATSVRTETLQSLPPVSDPPVPTSGMLEIPPCRMSYLYTHILAFQCNLRACCRIPLVAATGPTPLVCLILLRFLPP